MDQLVEYVLLTLFMFEWENFCTTIQIIDVDSRNREQQSRICSLCEELWREPMDIPCCRGNGTMNVICWEKKKKKKKETNPMHRGGSMCFSNVLCNSIFVTRTRPFPFIYMHPACVVWPTDSSLSNTDPYNFEKLQTRPNDSHWRVNVDSS